MAGAVHDADDKVFDTHAFGFGQVEGTKDSDPFCLVVIFFVATALTSSIVLVRGSARGSRRGPAWLSDLSVDHSSS